MLNKIRILLIRIQILYTLDLKNLHTKKVFFSFSKTVKFIRCVCWKLINKHFDKKWFFKISVLYILKITRLLLSKSCKPWFFWYLAEKKVPYAVWLRSWCSLYHLWTVLPIKHLYCFPIFKFTHVILHSRTFVALILYSYTIIADWESAYLLQ